MVRVRKRRAQGRPEVRTGLGVKVVEGEQTSQLLQSRLNFHYCFRSQNQSGPCPDAAAPEPRQPQQGERVARTEGIQTKNLHCHYCCSSCLTSLSSVMMRTESAVEWGEGVRSFWQIWKKNPQMHYS